MTGAEYAAFTADEWGPGWYWDETLFTLNGEEVDDIGEVRPDDEIVMLEGTIYKGDTPRAEAISALNYARRWLKKQAFTSIVVEVPNEDVASFKKDMKERRYRVL
jgi:hypothetical protein